MLSNIRQLWHYREAIRTMVARDLKVRYSNSILGFVWTLFSPLLMMLVFTLVFTVLIPQGIANYPVYFLAGLLPWNFFLASTLGSVSSIVGNGHLISRVYFPRDILPISIVLSNLVNFLLALVVLFALILGFGVQLGWPVLLLPGLIIIQCLFSAGLGLFLSALHVRFRDTLQVTDVVMQAWFFLTPIVYPIDLIRSAAIRFLIQAVNPLASLIVAYRDVLFYNRLPAWQPLLITSLEAAVLLGVGYWFFQKRNPYFVEEL